VVGFSFTPLTSGEALFLVLVHNVMTSHRSSVNSFASELQFQIINFYSFSLSASGDRFI